MWQNNFFFFFFFQNVLGMKSEMCVNKAVSFICHPSVRTIMWLRAMPWPYRYTESS